MPRFEVYLSGVAEPIELETDEQPGFEGPGWTEAGGWRIRNELVAAVRPIDDVTRVSGF